MKLHVAFVSVALVFAMTGFRAAASTSVSPGIADKELLGRSTEISKATPHVLSVISSATARHLFPVMDEKGLLLTCVAPELDKDKETEVFKDCTLAPGRTLDEVMHSFVRGIHEEQRLHSKEHAQSPREFDEDADMKNAQK
jgi:hypothetical protein